MAISTALGRVKDVTIGKAGIFLTTYQLRALADKVHGLGASGVTFEHGKFSGNPVIHTIEILLIDGPIDLCDINQTNISYSEKQLDINNDRFKGNLIVMLPRFEGAQCIDQINNNGGGGTGGVALPPAPNPKPGT